ncbi:MAG: hypothetical protein NT154_25875, partial [Verrucomicrobia bacterium]|nr:hypothetical protein [Verrucomicrobiota bacterium]
MKNSLLILLLTSFGLWAQTNPSLPAFPAPGPDPTIKAAANTNREMMLKRALQRAMERGTNAPAPGIAGSPARTIPTIVPPAVQPAAPNQPRTLPGTTPDSLAVPNLPSPTVAPASTTAPAEETIAPGMIDFRQADLNQVLDIYSLLVNRTILRPATLPAPTVTLKTQTLLTKKEAIQALDAVLGLNGITMINMGDKFVKAMAEAQGNQAGGRFDTNSAANLPEMGQYVTHVTQLKYAKPTEMVAVLQPFVKIPNAILPIDSSQVLVLRDYTENVKRMLELIERIDVAVPSEYDSVVIPIKYAKATEIASALNSLSTGGGAASVGGGMGGTRGSSRTTGMNRSGIGGVGGMGGMSGYPGQTQSGMMNPVGGQGAATPAGGSSFSQRLQNIIQRASTSGEIQILGQTKIISDERTNSLLIYASKEDLKTIKEIVAKLDIVLAQVLIEAVIL